MNALPFIFAAALLVAVIYACLFQHQQAVGHPGESRADEFEDAFTRWLVAKREWPNLLHDDCAPDAASYGVNEATAQRIRERVRREFERMK